jgi:hypothetical protein
MFVLERVIHHPELADDSAPSNTARRSVRSSAVNTRAFYRRQNCRCDAQYHGGCFGPFRVRFLQVGNNNAKDRYRQHTDDLENFFTPSAGHLLGIGLSNSLIAALAVGTCAFELPTVNTSDTRTHARKHRKTHRQKNTQSDPSHRRPS